MGLLDGKTAIVTGAARGIGKAIALKFASEGANIAFTDLVIDENAENTAKEIEAMGVKAKGYASNAANFEDTAKVVEAIHADFGRIDILVNNAGIIKRIPAVEMSVADFQQVLNIDLTGPFIMSKAVAPAMIKKGAGKIINMCSMMSEVGRDTVSAYAAAKGGLKMLTRNLATEWARYNIQVNGIGPGYFATAQTAPIRTEGHPFNEFIIKRTPAMRWGLPEDLGGSAVFLASRASDFVNGHVLYVDGGILASLGKASNEE